MLNFSIWQFYSIGTITPVVKQLTILKAFLQQSPVSQGTQPLLLRVGSETTIQTVSERTKKEESTAAIKKILIFEINFITQKFRD